MDESEHGQPLVAFDSQALRRLKPRQLAARFAFGAVASLIAGAVSIVLGPSIGGLFLAFPAILPATLTLLEREHGRVAAVFDMQGAALGAVALIAPRADDLSHGRVGETTARVIAGAPRMIDGGGTASRPRLCSPSSSSPSIGDDEALGLRRSPSGERLANRGQLAESGLFLLEV